MSDNEVEKKETVLPEDLLIIPLVGKPLFPGVFTPIMITASDDMQIIESAMKAEMMIGLLMVKDENIEIPDAQDLHKIGTVAKIVKKINLPDGGINIFISTIKRFEVKEFSQGQSPISAKVRYIDDDETAAPDEIKAMTRSLIAEMKTISDNNPLFSEEMRLNMVNVDHPGKIADFITSILNIDRNQQQEILNTINIKERMEKVLIFIKKEQELLRIQRKLTAQINEKIEKSQREYFLREEIKAIKKELGEPIDSKSSEHLKFKEKIDTLNFEGEIKEQVESELEKFSLMDPSSSEFIVTRNYLDTIVNLPWEAPKPDEINIERGQEILDEDHYGLEDVKERIIEYLSVRKLKNDNKGSIVCLVGPPGVGKTSIGKSIARALNREFFRFSVGGMRDEAEIKGHRRTYVGAMPGKLIQGLKIVKSQAPVFMIDEIDKLSSSIQGDPSSALLEALDPEQNAEFRDHYLDLPFDLSHILFICTANTLDTIPRPLMDRMEIIRLAGYIEDEKIEIARKYIIPKSLKKHGLEPKHIRYYKTALHAIADGYARDAGMRSFEKAIDRIHRKVAHKVVLGKGEVPHVIEKKNLEEYLKKAPFREEVSKQITKPGMAVGLAWTNFGGDTLILEAIALPGKGGLKLTGQMGDVMKESADIAFSYVKSISVDYDVDPEFFEKHIIHLHIPEGATPKDGPSAGITMATAFLSLITGRKVRKHLAMTGELSLTGKVLPIGGLKEKTIAARRMKIEKIIIPKPNERDLDDIPEYVREGIEFHPVKEIGEVFKLIFDEE
ncbi:MAG: endopeptidase La [Spirochaetales bacterium]|nr:endopeptidase La [Spirochaetales bacterium]